METNANANTVTITKEKFEELTRESERYHIAVDYVKGCSYIREEVLNAIFGLYEEE